MSCSSLSVSKLSPPSLFQSSPHFPKEFFIIFGWLQKLTIFKTCLTLSNNSFENTTFFVSLFADCLFVDCFVHFRCHFFNVIIFDTFEDFLRNVIFPRSYSFNFNISFATHHQIYAGVFNPFFIGFFKSFLFKNRFMFANKTISSYKSSLEILNRYVLTGVSSQSSSFWLSILR